MSKITDNIFYKEVLKYLQENNIPKKYWKIKVENNSFTFATDNFLIRRWFGWSENHLANSGIYKITDTKLIKIKKFLNIKKWDLPLENFEFKDEGKIEKLLANFTKYLAFYKKVDLFKYFFLYEYKEEPIFLITPIVLIGMPEWLKEETSILDLGEFFIFKKEVKNGISTTPLHKKVN